MREKKEIHSFYITVVSELTLLPYNMSCLIEHDSLICILIPYLPTVEIAERMLSNC